MRIVVGIDASEFAIELANEILTGGVTVIEAIESRIGAHLTHSIEVALGSRIVNKPRVVVHSHYFERRFETLRGLSASGYETWYPEIRFATRLEDEVKLCALETVGIEVGAIHYGGGEERTFDFKTKRLRTQTNHVLRLNQVTIPPAVFDDVIRHVEGGPGVPQPYIANLTLGPGLEGFRLVAFDHLLTGERVFCACHRSAHEAMLNDARSLTPRFAAGSWPHQVIHELDGARYVPAFCHLCVSSQDGPDEAAKRYSSSVHSHPGAYIDLLVRKEDLDLPSARSEAHRRLGIARWVREAELFGLAKKLFPQVPVHREASPPWLGRQRFDIYIPDLRLAIEHQGQQHYSAVSIFGGEAALESTEERDARKQSLAASNGVTIVHVRFDEPLTLAYLRQRLRRWIPQ